MDFARPITLPHYIL